MWEVPDRPINQEQLGGPSGYMHQVLSQLAGFFAAIRQSGNPGTTPVKKNQLLNFEWGLTGEPNCDIGTVLENLPGFDMTKGGSIPDRCRLAGKETKDKMMEHNGFTAEEATVLIGARTRGLNNDTDVVLPFSSQEDTNFHPHFHTFITAFAANNGLFL